MIVLYGVASPMLFLHSHNILHRDLALCNIFIDEDYSPKLSGFDLAKEIPQDSENGIIKEKDLLRRCSFLAPVILFNFEYSKSTDFFTFSIIMYELFCKQLKDCLFRSIEKNYLNQNLNLGIGNSRND